MLSRCRVFPSIGALAITVALAALLLPANVEAGKKWKYLAVAAALRPPHILPIPFPFEKASKAAEMPQSKVVTHHHHHIVSPPMGMPMDWPMAMSMAMPMAMMWQ